MPHKLSIITPSFNQGRFIARTIESVLSQEFSGDIEYLVMDGGSTDETVEILRRYGTRLSWISEKDGGQADAVNKGLARSDGNIIGWLNSDDIYYPGVFRGICDVFDSDPALDVVYADANHIDEDDRIIELYPTEELDVGRLLDTCYICQPTVFFRRGVVDRFGALDARLRYCMDYEYWVRLACAGAKFRRLSRIVAGSRLYAQNKTLGSRVRVHAEINDMLRRHARQVPDQWLFNYAHAVLDERGFLRSDRIRFPLLVGIISLYSALKWNHRISPRVARTVRAWAGSAVNEFWRRIVFNEDRI
jgi:glycosyltransferase involved in cell wall biosynthesis